MRANVLLSGGVWATTVLAFQGTSPLFMTSNSKSFKAPPSARQLSTTETINADVAKSLENCPSDVYIFASQPGISSDDFASDVGASTPFSQSGRPVFAVREVVGSSLDQEAATELLRTRCKAQLVEATVNQGASPIPALSSKHPQILRVHLNTLPLADEQRRAMVAENHEFLDKVVASLEGRSYTVVYHGTPPPESYSTPLRTSESSPNAAHGELKRRAAKKLQKRQEQFYDPAAGLFERYNFFSPAIFMGGIALLLLFSIGSVGVSALANVQVSYAAFSKEMGPSAQKKQQ